MNKFRLAACGGTFDLFHAGHKAFIEDALKLSEKVVLGITGDAYVKRFKNNLGIEDFTVRKAAVEQFLDTIGAKDRVAIIKIDDAYEPFLETSPHYKAIVVTEQTEETAKEINVKRRQNGISELEIIVSPMKKTEDGRLISSTRIRTGEINRDGKLYLSPQWQNKNLILPEALRAQLKKPWGEILNKIPNDLDGSRTVVVGDATAEMFNQKNVGQFLSIVDFLIHRERKFQQLSELGFDGENVKPVANPHGAIAPELFKQVQLAFSNKKRTVILVDGEDDLAVLPVLLISPLGFNIFYGQPDEGLVHVFVTEENKEKAYQLVKNFDKE
jgi:pantetheine-phosphate adenylyltransferase